ncbi:acyl-CoA dehydratase activase [Thermodesulfobacteriota bacterium]
MYLAGIDVGSTVTKAVVLKGEEIAAVVIRRTGAEHRRLTNKVMEEALAKAGIVLDRIDCVVATGYGRINVPFADKQLTEITCHAKGVSWLLPSAKTIIDIGGQDSKGIKLLNGKVHDFVMNDKCAAGTGRFLEVVAETLGIKMEDMGTLSLESDKAEQISNTCALFADEELAVLLGKGSKKQDIIAGIHQGVAARICNMAGRVKIEPDVVVTGGGGKNIGLVKSIEKHLNLNVLTPPEPLITGAIGAALLAKEQIQKKKLIVDKKKRKLEESKFFDKG